MVLWKNKSVGYRVQGTIVIDVLPDAGIHGNLLYFIAQAWSCFLVLIAPFDASIAEQAVGCVKVVRVHGVFTREIWVGSATGSVMIAIKGDDAAGSHVSASPVDSCNKLRRSMELIPIRVTTIGKYRIIVVGLISQLRRGSSSPDTGTVIHN